MNMSQELLRHIDAIARDRNVDKESLFTDIEQAMVSAARKHFNAEDTEDFGCAIDRETGQISISREGEAIPLEALGRIPAQTAKQVMIQKFREEERASIFEEFSGRVGEIVTGNAQRYEGGALVASIGRAEGFMPRSEQIPGEQHNPGERVRCMILDVREEPGQVKIVLSRSHADFVRRLFEVEVPEVSERVIEIKALAREPGHRTKVAVSSIDSKVDAVGACVGVRGSRIKNIVDELAGEKVDIVRWNESSQVLIANALRPAEVVEISLCFELGRATVVVNEDQLSLAIGKRGQNVRLAARLTGWDVDILTPKEFSRGLDTMEETLKTVEGVTDEMPDRIAALGLISVFDLEEVGADSLMEHLGDLGMTAELSQTIVQTCSERGKAVAQEQEKEREEAERAKAAEAAGIASGTDQGGGSASGGPGSDLVDILLAGPTESGTEEAGNGQDEPDASDVPADVALAQEQADVDADPEPTSPAADEIGQAQDETDVARLAEGQADSTDLDQAADGDEDSRAATA